MSEKIEKLKEGIERLLEQRRKHVEHTKVLDHSIDQMISDYLQLNINPEIKIGDTIKFQVGYGHEWETGKVIMYGYCNPSGYKKSKEFDLAYICDNGMGVTQDHLPEKIGNSE